MGEWPPEAFKFEQVDAGGIGEFVPEPRLRLLPPSLVSMLVEAVVSKSLCGATKPATGMDVGSGEDDLSFRAAAFEASCCTSSLVRFIATNLSWPPALLTLIVVAVSAPWPLDGRGEMDRLPRMTVAPWKAGLGKPSVDWILEVGIAGAVDDKGNAKAAFLVDGPDINDVVEATDCDIGDIGLVRPIASARSCAAMLVAELDIGEIGRPRFAIGVGRRLG